MGIGRRPGRPAGGGRHIPIPPFDLLIFRNSLKIRCSMSTPNQWISLIQKVLRTWVEPLRCAAMGSQVRPSGVAKMGTGIGPPFPGQMAENVTPVQSGRGGGREPPT